MVKQSRSGFTLAEVLTTLMVIGVVAAMTIPTLLNSTDDQQKKVAFKKAVSVLGQAIQLLDAQETECVVEDNHGLAACMKNVMNGTLYSIKAGSESENTSDSMEADTKAGTVLVTTDGVAYSFYYTQATTTTTDCVEWNTDEEGNKTTCKKTESKTTADKEAPRSITAICGRVENLGTAADDYNGKNSKCMVVVDVNGIGKGTKSFNSSIKAGEAVSDSYLGSDQIPLTITGGGVRPLYSGDGTGNASRGFKYMYGDSAKSPVVSES